MFGRPGMPQQEIEAKTGAPVSQMLLIDKRATHVE
jgi:hypothetical protein